MCRVRLYECSLSWLFALCQSCFLILCVGAFSLVQNQAPLLFVARGIKYALDFVYCRTAVVN